MCILISHAKSYNHAVLRKMHLLLKVTTHFIKTNGIPISAIPRSKALNAH